jgi:hypothetical protein
LQHSIDYWLWADLIAPESQRLLKHVVRVQRQEEADIFYVPFFTTISYFLLEKQECKALYRVWEHILRFNFRKMFVLGCPHAQTSVYVGKFIDETNIWFFLLVVWI